MDAPSHSSRPQLATCSQIAAFAAARFGEAAVFRRYTHGSWAHVTATHYGSDATHVMRGLLASGLPHGGRVLIIARPGYEPSVLIAACWAAGLVPIPLGHDIHLEALRVIFKDSRAVAAFTDRDDVVHFLRDAAGDEFSEDRVWGFGYSGGAGVKALVEHGTKLPVGFAAEEVAPTDEAVVWYSQGVSFRPQGVVVSHAALLHAASASARALSPLCEGAAYPTLVALSAENPACMVTLVRTLLTGTPLALTGPGAVVRHAEDLRPTVVISSPWLLQRLKSTADRRFGAAKNKRRRGQRGARIKEAMGGACSHFVAVGAPVSAELVELFAAQQLTIIQTYGPREACGLATATSAGGAETVPGSRGHAIDGMEIYVGELGDISLRGPSLFSKYADEATTLRRSVDAGGWFTTGDIGFVGEHGLVITGRTRDSIVTAAGHVVNPLAIEDAMRQHELVAHAVVVGEGRAGVGLLITCNHDAVLAWLATNGREDLAAHQMAEDPGLASELRTYVESVNESLAVHERVTRMMILPDQLTTAAGHLTPTLKVRRDVIVRDFSDTIDRMYGGQSADNRQSV